MAQIGEFSFIIIGRSVLGAVNQDYHNIVAISAITHFNAVSNFASQALEFDCRVIA